MYYISYLYELSYNDLVLYVSYELES